MSTPLVPKGEVNHGLLAIRRLDKMDVIVGEQTRQIKKLAEGMTVLTARQQSQPKGQPDWLRCRKPDAAFAILTSTQAWLQEAGREIGVVPNECWPWHPAAVAVLLAGAQHYKAVYSGDSTLAVVELVTRYWREINRLSAKHIGDICTPAIHRIGEASYRFDSGRLESLAIWWATSREGLPPGLSPKD